MLALALVRPLPLWASIAETVHNLSVSGPGEVKATSEQEICIFCHAPHNSSAQAPLWNRRDSRASYLLYGSSTLDAMPGQPTGATRQCLSCHDGTVALGEIVSETQEIEFPPGQRFLDTETGSLGTDLADDHPVSFVYDSDLAARDSELRLPDSIPPPVHLDAAGQMQCTSCHEPHDNSLGMFLLVRPTGGALCISCHSKVGWEVGAHATSLAGWDGTPPDPWPGSTDHTVADNACRSCHDTHTAAQPRRLVARTPEEQACYVCHNGHVAQQDLGAEFSKTYRHPLETGFGIHDPREDPVTAPRHVECVDCHEPHQARQAPVSAPRASGLLAGVRGIDADGQPVQPVVFQYEVCFGCHGDGSSANQAIPRTAGEINTRLEFAPDAISYHPVEQPGRNPDVPSLLPPWNQSSYLYCTDCHASDAADSGGSQGPHGSVNRFLLRARVEVEDLTPESPAAYALCYGCHSRSVILSDLDSPFNRHGQHVVDGQTPCSVCHDPHGIASSRGDPTGNTHLINFDTRVVAPSTSGQLRFEDRGSRSGACFVTCHGANHDPATY